VNTFSSPAARWHVRRLLILAIAAAALAGCSTKMWYEATKKSAEQECLRQPPGETERCLARVNPLTYEDYERRRTGGSP
jgi:hypothetical protein